MIAALVMIVAAYALAGAVVLAVLISEDAVSPFWRKLDRIEKVLVAAAVVLAWPICLGRRPE